MYQRISAFLIIGDELYQLFHDFLEKGFLMLDYFEHFSIDLQEIFIKHDLFIGIIVFNLSVLPKEEHITNIGSFEVDFEVLSG